mmetsp:Transcript_26098/g.76534  ORF Transcript_26098/g.76534 Transcript_26098/m.76534 type:complete len:388 (-) Transcript_26098:578-1741(-)
MLVVKCAEQEGSSAAGAPHPSTHARGVPRVILVTSILLCCEVHAEANEKIVEVGCPWADAVVYCLDACEVASRQPAQGLARARAGVGAEAEAGVRNREGVGMLQHLGLLLMRRLESIATGLARLESIATGLALGPVPEDVAKARGRAGGAGAGGVGPEAGDHGLEELCRLSKLGHRLRAHHVHRQTRRRVRVGVAAVHSVGGVLHRREGLGECEGRAAADAVHPVKQLRVLLVRRRRPRRLQPLMGGLGLVVVGLVGAGAWAGVAREDGTDLVVGGQGRVAAAADAPRGRVGGKLPGGRHAVDAAVCCTPAAVLAAGVCVIARPRERLHPNRVARRLQRRAGGREVSVGWQPRKWQGQRAGECGEVFAAVHAAHALLVVVGRGAREA